MPYQPTPRLSDWQYFCWAARLAFGTGLAIVWLSAAITELTGAPAFGPSDWLAAVAVAAVVAWLCAATALASRRLGAWLDGGYPYGQFPFRRR